jgi:hypothetical protein
MNRPITSLGEKRPLGIRETGTWVANVAPRLRETGGEGGAFDETGPEPSVVK